MSRVLQHFFCQACGDDFISDTRQCPDCRCTGEHVLDYDDYITQIFMDALKEAAKELEQKLLDIDTRLEAVQKKIQRLVNGEN